MRYLIAILLLLTLPARAALDITGASIESNGEFIRIFVSNCNTNGAFDYGYGTNASSFSKVRFRFTVPSSGTGGNITEYFTGTKTLNYAWPFQSNQWVEATGALPVPLNDGVMIRAAMSKRVTISDTGGLLDVDANWYSNNTAVVGMTITNNSLLTYGSLRPITMWRSIPWQLAGSNVLLKVVARTYFAETNPAYSVDLWANSGAVNTPTQTIYQPFIYPDAGDPVPVQEYGQVLNYGVFAQGATVTNHFTVKERRGTNVFSTITSPFGPDHPDYAPLISFCDKSNRWPYVVALVDATNGTTAGVAVTNWSTATNGSTPAFATIAQAKHAAGLTNNAVNGTNSYSQCFIMFANSNAQQYAWMGGETPGTRGASTTWTHYMPLPGLNKTNVQIGFNTGGAVGQRNIKDHIKGVFVSWSSSGALSGNGNGHMWMDDCLIGTNSNSGTGIFSSTTNAFFTYNTFLRMRAQPSLTMSASLNSSLRMWGNTILGFPENTSVTWTPGLFVGNDVRPTGTQQQFILKNDLNITLFQGLQDPVFWSFNNILNQDLNITTVAIGLGTNLSVGAVVDNSLFETRNYGTQPQYDIMQSQKANEGCTNYMSSGITCLQVYHPLFELGTNSSMNGWQDKNAVFSSLAYRGDVSGAFVAGTNRWGRYFSVDCEGLLMMLIGTETFPDMRPWNAQATANNGFNGTSTIGITNLGRLLNNPLGFVDNRSAYGGSTNGFGNYLFRLDSIVHSTNATYAVRPNNVYPYDNRGITRGRWIGKTPDTPGVYSQNKLRFVL